MLALIVGVVYFGAQNATFLFVSQVVADPRIEQSFGLLVSLATIVAASLGVGLTVFFAALRKDFPLKAYLAFHRPATEQLRVWAAYLVLFMLALHAVAYVLGRPFVTEFEAQLYKTAQNIPLLLLTVVAAAPIFEELFVRGFIYQGLASSRIGPTGAIIVTAALWSSIHVQYDPIEMGMIFAGGLLLGYARLRSDSIFIPIGMHALWNLTSSVETMLLLD
ncbi:MAG: lysostaphin resistance A-like protein [Acidiferrobacterales bacterium]